MRTPIILHAAGSPLLRWFERHLAAFRAVPIRWRILSVALVNTLAVLVLAAFVWQNVGVLTRASADLKHARDAERSLTSLRTSAERLQGLVHRYFTQPTDPVLSEIERQRTLLLQQLETIRASRPSAEFDPAELVVAVQRVIGGFDELKTARAAVAATYEQQVLKPAREIAGLYALIDTATPRDTSLIWHALGRSREAFSTALVATNSFYFSQDTRAAFETRESLTQIEQTVPVMVDLADNDLQRNALQSLRSRVSDLLAGFNRLATGFRANSDLLRTAIDDSQNAMAAVIDRMASQALAAEDAAAARYDAALFDVLAQIAVAGIGFMAASILVGVGAARSISAPLQQLKRAMNAVMAGRERWVVPGTDARDEIGDMARALDFFQDNAIARRQAEKELRTAKERAEAALDVLRRTQASLIEAEKMAALGALVAGVAHEVNNPVGISLTVASSLARRCEAMEEALAEGPLKRSTFNTFITDNREAATQLVANLQRAGELVQAFKQVAVDRSHADRRSFDLAETTRQIVASLLPAIRKQGIEVELSVPEGLTLESFPGPYGQVLTNLLLNCAAHAFPDGEAGRVYVRARLQEGEKVCITVEDDGQGMSDDVMTHAFEPFFTTRRAEGGTGLGLHIVYNLVTHRLGGQVGLESVRGEGTTFRILLPLTAPD